MMTLLIATVLALAAACGGSDGETTTAADDTSSSSTLPDGCEEAPATTAVGQAGGGEIVCESPGDPGSGDPADTTVPAETVPAGSGLVRGTLGGTPCSLSSPDEPCAEIFEQLTGTVTFTPTRSGEPVSVEVTADAAAAGGQFEAAMDPGPYEVTAEATTADGTERVCPRTDVTVAGGEVTEVNLTCAAP